MSDVQRKHFTLITLETLEELFFYSADELVILVPDKISQYAAQPHMVLMMKSE